MFALWDIFLYLTKKQILIYTNGYLTSSERQLKAIEMKLKGKISKI